MGSRVIWAYLGRFLALFWAVLGLSWLRLGVLGPLLSHFRPVLGGSGPILGRLLVWPMVFLHLPWALAQDGPGT